MRAALAIGSFVIVLGVMPSRARAEACKPAAVLAGDASLVDTVDTRLRARGVVTNPGPECPHARVKLAQRGTDIAVTVVDADGRQSERVLADTTATAALIESWVRRDLNEAALDGFMPDVAVTAEPASLADRVDAGPPPRDSSPVRPRLQVAAAVETALAFEGGTWFGARGGACVRVGRICAGASGRYLANEATSIDVLGTVEVPFALHPRLDLVVGVGAGVGRFTSVRVVEDVSVVAGTTYGARVEGRAELGVRITRHVGFHLGASVGGSPSAPVRTGDQGWRTNNEPTGFVRFDAGLRVGGP